MVKNQLYQQEIYTQDLRLQIDFRDGSKECLHTAFNVDKVVEQIEHRRANFDCKLCKYNDDEKTICSEDCSDALIDDLIKIVKEGGLNERNSFQGKAD